MARRLRVEFAGAIYHITVRGNSCRAIFKDNHDRENFLERLGQAVGDYGTRIYLYSLLVDHYHLLVETPKANISLFMGTLGTGHAVYFNKRHRDVGHLYQGRFNARLVEGDEYLLKLSRYVHLNPVHTKVWTKRPLDERLAALRNYPWSSYLAYVGKVEPPEWLTCGPALAQIGGRVTGRQRRYAQYVESGLTETDKEFEKVVSGGGIAIGDADFMEAIEKLAVDKVVKLKKMRDSDFRPVERCVPAATILRVVASAFETTPPEVLRTKRGSYLKAVAAKMLLRHGGLTNREAAEILGLKSGSGVSWQVQRLQSAMHLDTKLEQTIQKIGDQLKIEPAS